MEMKNNGSDSTLPPLQEPGLLYIIFTLQQIRIYKCFITFIIGFISFSTTSIDEIRHSKLTRKISTDPVQESLTLPKLVLKAQEVS